MKLMFGVALAATISTALAAQAPVVPQSAGEAAARHITLAGCVVKGDSGYVLADATEQVKSDGIGYDRTAPDPFHSRTLYWLDDDDDLKDHVGQRVEVSGKTKARLQKGEIEVDRKDDGVELEFKADGKKVKVMVPDTAVAVGTSGSVPNKDNDYNIVVMTIDVKSVKKIANTCGSGL
jgi:hypothetical protein